MYNLFIRNLTAEFKETKYNGNYAIQVEGDTIYILFQWSRGVADWISNFNFPKKPYKRMNEKWYVHRGFLKVWRGMRDEIECEVLNILTSSPNIKNIYCVGYSHGGALALLCTEDMEFLHGESYVIMGVGFASPRVVWGSIPGSVKKRFSKYYVVRNIGDIVTHLPPLFFGFRNAGTLIKIGKLFKYNPINAHFNKSYKEELYIEGEKENG